MDRCGQDSLSALTVPGEALRRVAIMVDGIGHALDGVYSFTRTDPWEQDEYDRFVRTIKQMRMSPIRAIMSL